MSVKTTTIYRGPGYPVDPAKELDRVATDHRCEMTVFEFARRQFRFFVSASEHRPMQVRFSQIHNPTSWGEPSRTIRRVETIVNFKDEFGRNERPDWSEFAWPKDIWDLPECVAAGRLPE